MAAVYPVGIDYTSFDTRSTTTTTPDNHYLFYTHLKDLTIFVQNKRENITWSSSLFQHITYLVVTTPVRNLSWWNSLSNIGKNNTHISLSCPILFYSLSEFSLNT
ncbi:unnamed protein product [Adineta steineri]|uniref:Uncharacterized protein n=1 Tax=Adineta steineri TaxID=433720 RepID=A0A820LY48_9BILA|nr:unnamed protein product [Adineta steineri]